MTAIVRAELLSIGTELTTGETRDTNAGDLARDLTAHGVVVERLTALPDDLEAVTAAFADGLARAELVVSTGGLGPTPDDLTREAIAALAGETPAVDPGLETWLRELFARRNLDFPEPNSKQAWLIPSATAIPNDHGTAPGWWVARPDGRLIVALPGPPREMRPMWDGWVLSRLRERGLGRLTQTSKRMCGAPMGGARWLASSLSSPVRPINAWPRVLRAKSEPDSARSSARLPAAVKARPSEPALAVAVQQRFKY